MLTPIQAVQLRKRLGKVLVAVATTQQGFIIQRAGIPTAVLLPLQEYQNLRVQAGEVNQQDNLLGAGQIEVSAREPSFEQGSKFPSNALNENSGPSDSSSTE